MDNDFPKQIQCPHWLHKIAVTHEQQYQLLIESLRLVAAEPDEQLSSLPDFVIATEEVLTTVGDAFLLVPQLVKAKLLKPDAVDAIARLDEWFSRAPLDGSVVGNNALKTHSFWKDARQLAAEALACAGELKIKPTLKHIVWMPAQAPNTKSQTDTTD